MRSVDSVRRLLGIGWLRFPQVSSYKSPQLHRRGGDSTLALPILKAVSRPARCWRTFNCGIEGMREEGTLEGRNHSDGGFCSRDIKQGRTSTSKAQPCARNDPEAFENGVKRA